VHSRAYIAFKTEEFVAKFSREYDGHMFKDKAGLVFFTNHFLPMLGAYHVATCSVTQGNESQAVVEFAPYQKLPLEKKKVDARNATIDQGMFQYPPRLSSLIV
jgi:regulator of nonsense transcripts 3